MFGSFEVDNLHQPFIRVGIVARQRWSPWESIAVSRGWTVVWVAEDSPTQLTSSRVLFDSLSLHFFIRSKVSIILTDVRLPGPDSFWWHPTNPLLLAIGIRMPKKLSYSTSCWHHQIIPWSHSSCGGVSAATGKCHVGTHMTMEPHTVTLPCLPRRSLSSVLSTTVGGRTFKARRKAEWPPRVECLTTTTWHSGGPLPSFTQGVTVTAIDVHSHTNWVRRALQPGELITAFEISAATQATFTPEVITQVCASLPTLTPVGILRLLLSILVPLKGHSFTGGSSPLEKFPSRQKVAMLETAKTRQPKPDVALIEAPLISPVELVPTTEVPMFIPVPDADPIVFAATRMFISAPSPSVSPAYSPAEGIVVSATSLSGSPSYPPSESFESLSTSKRIVISATSLSGSPSYPPPAPFESQSTSRRIRSPSGSPSHSPFMPMKRSAKGPTLSGRIRTSSPPLGVGGISSIPSEYPRPSPITESNVPGVTKRGRPGSPASSDVVPEAKRFAIATKSDDAEVPEHL
jgi:hypothetical protein